MLPLGTLALSHAKVGIQQWSIILNSVTLIVCVKIRRKIKKDSNIVNFLAFCSIDGCNNKKWC